MRVLLVTAAFAASALVSSCGFGAPTYPTFGDTAYRIEGTTASPNGGAPVTTIIYRDGPKMRVETTIPGQGPGAIVFNEATNAAYVLAAATPTAAPATTQPAPGATPAAAAPATVPATPAAAPVAAAGVAVRVADAEAPQPLEAPWAALGAEGAQSTGQCTVAGESGRNWRPRAETQGTARTACITDDGIVLEVREGETVLFQATRLERGPQAATLFGVPPGYQVIDPQAVVESVGETMEQLDSVTGQPKLNTPTPTTPAPTTTP